MGNNLVQGIHGTTLFAKDRLPSMGKVNVLDKTAQKRGCPFCRGQDHLNEEVDRIAGPSGNWKLRRIINHRPINGGTHHLIIPNQKHELTYSQMSANNLYQLFKYTQKAVREMEQKSDVNHVSVGVNEGVGGSGASEEHCHLHVFGLPFVPPAVQKLVDFSSQNIKSCGFCDLAKEPGIWVEFARQGGFTAFVHGDPQAYYPVTIMGPHLRSLVDLPDKMLRRLSSFFKSVLGAVNEATKFSPYNLLIRSGPKGSDYHFHIDILPQIGVKAAAELESGIAIIGFSSEKMANDIQIHMS